MGLEEGVGPSTTESLMFIEAVLKSSFRFTPTVCCNVDNVLMTKPNVGS